MSGIVGGIFAGMLVLVFRVAATNARARFDVASGAHVARYPLVARAFTWLLMVVPIGLLVALLTVTENQFFVGACVCLVAMAGALSLLLEFNFARATWSESCLVFQSPWCKVRSIAWDEVREVQFSRAASWLVIRGGAGVRIRLSSLLGGLPDLFQSLRTYGPPELRPDIENAFSQWRK